MAQLSSVDYDAKRLYCHADTVIAGFDIIAAYFEVNALRQANLSGEQNRAHMLSAEGNIPKGAGIFTPKYGYLVAGWRIVPYGSVTHTLTLSSEPVSADGLSGRDVFDRSSLAVVVDIDEAYEKVEIREVNTGSGVTPTDITNITASVVASIYSRVIENGETFEEVIRLMRADAAGNIVVNGLQHKLKSADGLTDRIIANADAAGRTVTSTNGA